jgi:hypothetical protein
LKKISVKVHNLIQAIAFRASDEFLSFFYLGGGIVALYEDLQACHRQLNLERLLILSPLAFSHDLMIINQYCRLNRGTFTPYCLRQKTGSAIRQ